MSRRPRHHGPGPGAALRRRGGSRPRQPRLRRALLRASCRKPWATAGRGLRFLQPHGHHPAHAAAPPGPGLPVRLGGGPPGLPGRGARSEGGDVGRGRAHRRGRGHHERRERGQRSLHAPLPPAGPRGRLPPDLPQHRGQRRQRPSGPGLRAQGPRRHLRGPGERHVHGPGPGRSAGCAPASSTPPWSSARTASSRCCPTSAAGPACWIATGIRRSDRAGGSCRARGPRPSCWRRTTERRPAVPGPGRPCTPWPAGPHRGMPEMSAPRPWPGRGSGPRRKPTQPLDRRQQWPGPPGCCRSCTWPRPTRIGPCPGSPRPSGANLAAPAASCWPRPCWNPWTGSWSPPPPVRGPVRRPSRRG